ncbi:ThiF family adenylyltransferase [Haloferula sp. A504]|uniref:tRNA threonylcarbamoyladenosine dehydratase n=1 Tax=Haloferula sp. A504 TaxID=3373601 RepID=UPI0031BF3A45|nr:tRNA threonylcarbamoyladenosine dehydratase [Verrucomicrobiaceae bacterium E54]
MSDAYLSRFSGIARLYGEAALHRFRTAHVAVVGLGGVGSWAAESLVRSGIGRLTLMDADDLCVTNTNRQLHAVEGNIGRQKTSTLAERLRTINPGVELEEIHAFYSPSTAGDFFSTPPDAVVDAIDALRAKCHLLAGCHARNVLVVASGAAGGRRDATCIRIADLAQTSRDPLLAAVRKRLRTEFGFPKAPERGAVPDFGIDAVFSDEPPVFPTCDGGISSERPEDLPGSIGCDAGYGSVTHVTATFGLAAAGRILERLASG